MFFIKNKGDIELELVRKNGFPWVFCAQIFANKLPKETNENFHGRQAIPGKKEGVA